MADRKVDRSGKDRYGDITSLCGAWGDLSKSGVISDISTRAHSYFTNTGGHRANVRVAQRNGKPYLTTCPDGVKPNNLDNLPDC